jgi:hypothetical protein
MTLKFVAAAALLASSAFAAGDHGHEISLWPNGAPGSAGQTSPEVPQGPDSVKNFTRISNVNNPR